MISSIKNINTSDFLKPTTTFKSRHKTISYYFPKPHLTSVRMDYGAESLNKTRAGKTKYCAVTDNVKKIKPYNNRD